MYVAGHRGSAYTEQFLNRDLLHTEAFTQSSLYTEQPLHADAAAGQRRHRESRRRRRCGRRRTTTATADSRQKNRSWEKTYCRGRASVISLTNCSQAQIVCSLHVFMTVDKYTCNATIKKQGACYLGCSLRFTFRKQVE